MPKKIKSERITIRLTAKRKEQLELEADKKDITLSECISNKIEKQNRNMKRIDKETMKEVKQITCELSTEFNKFDNEIDVENAKNNIIEGARKICAILSK